MRIGIIIYGSPAQLSGGYLYDRILADHLRQSGLSVDFLSLKKMPYVFQPVVPMRMIFPAIRRPPGKFDLIIVDELCHPALALRLGSIKRLAGCPIVVLVHHLKRNERVWFLSRIMATLLEQSLLRHADGIIANSSSTRHEIEQLVPFARPLVVAQPAGNRFNIPHQKMSEKNIILDSSKFRVLFVGNVIPRKGADTLIDSLILMKREKQKKSL